MAAGGNGILGGRGGIVEKDFNRTISKLEKDDDVKAVIAEFRAYSKEQVRKHGTLSVQEIKRMTEEGQP